MILRHVHPRVSFIMYDPGDLYFSDVLSSFENCFHLLSALQPVPDGCRIMYRYDSTAHSLEKNSGHPNANIPLACHLNVIREQMLKLKPSSLHPLLFLSSGDALYW